VNDDSIVPGLAKGASQSVHAMSANENDCAAIQDLAHDYVLASATEARERIEAHCHVCPSCREYLADIRATAILLAFSSPAAAPPPTAKAALFARVAQSSRESQPSYYMGSLADLTTPTLPSSHHVKPPPRQAPRKRDWLTTYFAPLATVPLLLALGLVGYWGISTRMELDDRTETIQVLNSRIQALNARIDSSSSTLSNVDEYFASGTAKQYAMLDPQPEVGNEAFGMMFANPSGDKAVLMCWKLDPSVETYQVWIETADGRSENVGTLYADSNGYAMEILDLGTSLSQVTSVHVRPEMNGITSDTQITTSPDVLYATIWPGLGREQDTAPAQQH
jgi:hypothetical protein